MDSPAPTIEQRRTTSGTALLESLRDGVFLLDERGVIVHANQAAARMLATHVEGLRGCPLSGMLAEPHGGQLEAVIAGLQVGAPQEGATEPHDVVARREDGSGIAIELTVSQMREGQYTTLLAVARDIRDQKRAEAHLRRLADHDSLTGLLSRTSFEQSLTRHVEFAARYGSGGSVIALGVDSFKYVNESLGTAAGDELLTTIAASLSGRLRKTDMMGRVGGDVFGVLVHATDRAKARVLAEELVGIVRRHAFVFGGEPIRVTVSAGITTLDERSVTGAELLAESEAALNLAKESGRDRVATYDPTGRTELDERRAWTERVRQATERGLFVLVSQPIVDLSSGDTTQHEVLLRMRGDGGDGLVAPGEFLATAERFGLIGGVDRWVTQQSVRLIAAHNREGRELKLEVNLSGKTMGDPRFPDEVKRELKASGIDPASLIFEVTETAAVADIEQARTFAHSLARLGCRFALDDFGAGYASFYYLKHLPISYLKIDGEFVRELPGSRTDQLIVKALVEVCEGLGIKTVAEFVADEATLDIVKNLGVDFAQGYHFGKPEPVSELRAD